MKTQNIMHLELSKAAIITDKLNVLLANYQMFYQNVRGFHWNIEGNRFFELHKKFEELYTMLAEHIDEIAERILTLGNTPDHTFSDYLSKSQVQEARNIKDADACVRSILDAFSVILALQREILQLTDEFNDEGTNALMSDYIREIEKLAWMYNAYLK